MNNYYFTILLLVSFRMSSGFLRFDENKVYLFNFDSSYNFQQKNPISNFADGVSANVAVRSKNNQLYYSMKGDEERKVDGTQLKPIDIATKNYQELLENNALSLLTYDVRSLSKYFNKNYYSDFPFHKKFRMPMGTCNATITIQRRSYLTQINVRSHTKNCLVSRKFMQALRKSQARNSVIDEIQNEINIQYSNAERQIQSIKITSFVDIHFEQRKVHSVRKVSLKYVGAYPSALDWEQKILMKVLSVDKQNKQRNG